MTEIIMDKTTMVVKAIVAILNKTPAIANAQYHIKKTMVGIMRSRVGIIPRDVLVTMTPGLSHHVLAIVAALALCP